MAQATVAEIMEGDPTQGYFHHHISCLECLREIEEVKLESPMTFVHEDVSESISRWKPDDVKWSINKVVKDIPYGDWSRVNYLEQSYHIGRACGFLYGDLELSNDSRANDIGIFPLSLQKKVIPRSFMGGIIEGLIRASSIHCVSRRSISELKRPRSALLGVGLHLISEVSNHPSLINLWRTEEFESLFQEIPSRVTPSYPTSNSDLGALGKSYMRYIYIKKYVSNKRFKFRYSSVWVFADINDVKIVGMLSISSTLVPLLYRDEFNKRSKNIIRGSRETIISLKDPESASLNVPIDVGGMLRTNEEIRHASKSISSTK